MTSTKLKICIIGSGAIGSLYGGKLAQAGHLVDIVARSHANDIRNQGIQVKSCWGDFLFSPNAVFDSQSECTYKYDIVLVAVKALPENQSEAFVQSVIDLLTDDGSVFVIQNGLNVEAPFAGKHGSTSVMGGLAFVCANRICATEVHHIDFGRLVLGKFSGNCEPTIAALVESFNKVGVPAKLSENLMLARWSKLVWNIAFNPLSVICDKATTQELLETPETELLCRNLMNEIVFIARKTGVELPSDIVYRNLNDTRKMPPYKTSMLLDYEANRPMEIEAICGEALRIANNSQLKVPNIEAIYAILKLISKHQVSSI